MSGQADALSLRKRALLETALARRREAAAKPAIERRTDPGPAPLSFPQQRMWFLDQLDPGSFTHNAARAFRLRGGLDVAALERALDAVIERHPTLRTVVAVEDRLPCQVVLDSWALELPVVDLAGLAPAGREAELGRLLRERSREPFDLAADLMFRASLVRLGPREHVLLIGIHHIAGDAASDQILFRDLGLLYDGMLAGVPVELAPAQLEYADFAVWQRERLQGARLEDLVSYWAAHLEGAPALIRLPIDRPRPEVQRHVGARRDFMLPGELADGVHELARAHGATPYMVLLAAFATLLHRAGAQDDVVVGTPIANRTHVGLEEIVGFFSNTTAVRVKLAGSPSFAEVVRRVREAALGAYAHQDLPFDNVVGALQVPRARGWNPVFQVNFRARARGPVPLALAGLAVEPITVDIGFSRFDLSLELQFGPRSLEGYFEYDVDLFELATVDGLVENLGALLAQVVADADTEILALTMPHQRAPGPPAAGAIRRGVRGAARGGQRS